MIRLNRRSFLQTTKKKKKKKKKKGEIPNSKIVTVIANEAKVPCIRLEGSNGLIRPFRWENAPPSSITYASPRYEGGLGCSNSALSGGDFLVRCLLHVKILDGKKCELSDSHTWPSFLGSNAYCCGGW